MLNLRADYASTLSAVLERNLTLLLESRLANVPEYVVLERRHAWSLGFEHGLDPAAKPLLRGASLIDGTPSVPAATGELTATLRVRSPDGAATLAAMRGSTDNLPVLADRLLAAVERAVGKTVAAPLSAGQEAREYLLEGLWGQHANAPAAALEALNSAGLLGANPDDVDAVRLWALIDLVDEGMENWLPSIDFAGHDSEFPTFDAAALTRKTDAALRAIRDVTR